VDRDPCSVTSGESGKRVREVWLEGDTPPRVCFVRVASKGLMLDAASRFADVGLEVVAFSVGCKGAIRATRKGLASARFGEAVLETSGRVPLPAFCKRAWNSLIRKKLWECCFLKSAQEYENRALIFPFFSQKSEESEREAVGRLAMALCVAQAANEMGPRKADPSLRSG
jgi:hypothetical protein